jgi:acyl-CoA thioester hydrolase
MSEQGLGRWPVEVEIPVAWGDMDAFGHVNNTVFLRWFETARIAYFDRAGISERKESEGIGPILARQVIDYRLPITYPDRMQVATTVTKLGNTSLTMAFRIKSLQQAGALAAEGEGVIVMLDYRRGTKFPLDQRLRSGILQLESTGLGANDV